MDESQDNLIKIGDYIIVQRQKVSKLCKFASLDTTVALGKETIELRALEGHKYFTTFKMIAKDPTKPKKRLYSLELCTEITKDIREFISNRDSGQDNRDIKINDNSQNLSQKEIEALRDSGVSSKNIIEQLVENSKTFSSKTEFGQEKYLKKKEKKYFEYVQIRKPTMRLIADILIKQDPEKVLGIRQDTLSQLITYANIHDDGTYLMYECGSQGLIPAVVLNAIGANTTGRLLHMHQGAFPQKFAIQCLNLEEEQLKRCLSVNLFSSLKLYHNRDTDNDVTVENKETEADAEPPAKIQKLDETSEKSEPKPKPKWYYDNVEAVKILDEKVDGLIIATREHPWSILCNLLPFVKASRNLVIYHPIKEVLTEVFLDLKAGNRVTGIRLISNWMRNYQVLPNRTHPEVMMSGNSGYLLTGIVIEQ